MLILFLALIFGVVVLLFLLKNMKSNFGAQLRGHGIQKVRAMLKAVLLVLVVVYILIFVVVIIKTLII